MLRNVFVDLQASRLYKYDMKGESVKIARLDLELISKNI